DPGQSDARRGLRRAARRRQWHHMRWRRQLFRPGGGLRLRGEEAHAPLRYVLHVWGECRPETEEAQEGRRSQTLRRQDADRPPPRRCLRELTPMIPMATRPAFTSGFPGLPDGKPSRRPPNVRAKTFKAELRRRAQLKAAADVLPHLPGPRESVH